MLYKVFAPRLIQDYQNEESKVSEGKIWTNLILYIYSRFRILGIEAINYSYANF